MLLTIPGFLTAQRFHCAQAAGVPVRAPFLALYRLAGPGVMTSDGYTSKAGRMSVDPDFRVNMTNWDRNLVQGPAGTGQPDLAVDMGGHMTLIDRLTAGGGRPRPDDCRTGRCRRRVRAARADGRMGNPAVAAHSPGPAERLGRNVGPRRALRLAGGFGFIMY